MGSYEVGPYMTVFPGIHHYLDYYKILVPANYKDNYSGSISRKPPDQ